MFRLTKSIYVVTNWACVGSALSLLAMMALTSADVMLRYIGHPIKGTVDIVSLLGAVVVALPIAHVEILGRHVSMEFLENHTGPVVSKISSGICSLLGIGVYGLITRQCILLASEFSTTGRVSDTIEIPLSPFVYLIALGCAINCFVLIVKFLKLFTHPENKEMV